MVKATGTVILAMILAMPFATLAQRDTQATADQPARTPTTETQEAGNQSTGGVPAQSTADPVEDPDGTKAHEIVQKADEIRFPQDAFQVDVSVKSTTDGEQQEPRLYRILSKGNENTIVQTLEPATEQGQNMLMRGRDLWVYMPSVSQPVRLSLSQRLTGQVANGDLARANFSGDYTAKLLRTELVDGHAHHVLELTAAARGVTYPKVVYWVRADNNHPYKAEFFALSGRLLKTCMYENFAQLGGRLRPTRLVMADALKGSDQSVLEYSELVARELPDRMFTKDYMKRLD